MKWIAALLLFLVFSLTSSSSESLANPPAKTVPKENVLPMNWQYFMRQRDSIAFYDKNSTEILEVKDGLRVDVGLLLKAYVLPVEVKMADGTTKMAWSKTTVVIMECKTGILESVVEYWYDTRFPTSDQKPIAKRKSTPADSVGEVYPPGTGLNNILCETYT